jgi:predicted nucleic acid-binding protein
VDLIVDASIVLKWFVIEDDSEAAIALRAEHLFSAPDLLLIECRNALLNKVRRQVLLPEQVHHLETQLSALDVAVLPSTQYLSHAFQIALDLGETIYDCIYLAAALATDRPLLTADARFAAKIAASSIDPKSVRLFAAGSR